MKECKIYHLDTASLAERELMLHPEKADWQETSPAGEEVDASVNKGLRVVCSNCGSIVEKVEPSAPNERYFTCPDCGEKWFYVYSIVKKKRTRVRRKAAPRREPATEDAAAAPTPREKSAAPVTPARSSTHWDYSWWDGELITGLALFLLLTSSITYLFVIETPYPPFHLSIQHFFGSETAASKIVYSHLNGKGWLQPRDEKKAWEVCEKYANQGDTTCAKMLADHYDERAQYYDAAYWYEKTSDWSMVSQCYKRLAENTSSEKNKIEAYMNAINSIERIYSKLKPFSLERERAAGQIGELYENIYQLTEDDTYLYKASEWYSRSSYQTAKERVDRMLQKKLKQMLQEGLRRTAARAVPPYQTYSQTPCKREKTESPII